MNSADVVAYTYCADIFCPRCLVELMIAEGSASPAAREMSTEDVLDQVAGANAIDRSDERSFDSDEFPKVVFEASIVDADVCGGCGEGFE